ncbi:bifunctional aspartokinase/homoserine dehydrogenase 2, chloroplastic-like isoform X2 [Hibiscus syriacus]|uniref:bifunctional aspartokinase/homoserine dehydrogenase 2, chloroplastic-like isoform X2 n=1 Tax=Hibiscus syriacus TaxID=106335 RepID=UPI001924365B|nr:bifunctional aspartokinase/homoserine dehydrogenase 2, chloroplastic-like isoform X2 [Hibiscus syriacus]
MSKVTDMMFDLINKARSRDDSYISALDAVLEKHNSTALDLLDGDDLATFLSQLHHDVSNLKAMLRAIYIEWDRLQMDGYKGGTYCKSH